MTMSNTATNAFARSTVEEFLIHEAALLEIQTNRALAARVAVLKIFAIDGFGQNARNRGFEIGRAHV